MATSIAAKNLCKSFNKLRVLDKWNLEVHKSERIALVGPSGAGKTTFLRLVAGMDRPTSGEILVNTTNIGFVFQESRLIPWRTIRENLLFVNANGDIEEVLEKLRLSEFKDYFPAQLSGGMQQRVNLARALIVNPELLILDEPFSSLDLPVKISIMEDLLQEWRKSHFTMITVTHDLKEALYLSDRILILSSQPSHIVSELKVKLGENRNFSDPALLNLESELLNMLSQS